MAALPADQEKFLIEKVKSEDFTVSQNALEKLLEQYVPLVSLKKKAFFIPNYDDEDIAQELRLALTKAFMSYEYGHDTKLLTHCENHITYHMGNLNKLSKRDKRKIHYTDMINITDPMSSQTGTATVEDYVGDVSLPDIEVAVSINAVSSEIFSGTELRLLRLLQKGDRKNEEVAHSLGRSVERTIQLRQQIRAKLRQLMA